MSDKNTLVVLWTSGDREVAEKMVFMYSYNAKKKGWWKEVRFIIWGPSAKLVVEDAILKEKLIRMREEGVVVEACRACAEMLGVDKALEELGVQVCYMGGPLTDYLKSGYSLLTI